MSDGTYEVFHERHDYECGRNLFPDVECGCWDGPRVTPEDLRWRRDNGTCVHPVALLSLFGDQWTCKCGRSGTLDRPMTENEQCPQPLRYVRVAGRHSVIAAVNPAPRIANDRV